MDDDNDMEYGSRGNSPIKSYDGENPLSGRDLVERVNTPGSR
jgi:hypothetical protein